MTKQNSQDKFKGLVKLIERAIIVILIIIGLVWFGYYAYWTVVQGAAK